MNHDEKDTARIYTRSMLRAALIAELDDWTVGHAIRAAQDKADA